MLIIPHNLRVRFATRIIGAIAVIAMMTAACSDDDPGNDAPTPVPTSAEPTTADTAASDDAEISAVEDVYERFWDAVIAAENTAEENYDSFVGLAAEGVIQEQVARIRSMENNGIHREGAPDRTDRTVVVDGSTARVEECVDEAPWTTWRGDEQLDTDDRGPLARVFDFERVEGQWLITQRVDMDEATLQC